MIQYLRIPKNKFWAWVFASLALGVIVGAGAAYAVSRSSATSQVDDLKRQLASQAAQAASTLGSVQSRLDSADASLTALSQQYAQLQQQKTTATPKTTSSSATTPTVALKVISRTVTPSTVASGALITLTARVQGSPTKVTMRITSRVTGSSTTYSLKKSSTSGSVQRWRLTVKAPKTKGAYTYYATAYRGSKSATMPGASPSKFTVK